MRVKSFAILAKAEKFTPDIYIERKSLFFWIKAQIRIHASN